jgi:hypothetical protein
LAHKKKVIPWKEITPLVQYVAGFPFSDMGVQSNVTAHIQGAIG